jgi:hypothetical protein
MPIESNFVPRLDALPPSQRRLWDELGTIPSEFVLYGGTALALHLGHRQSVDFDFFGSRAFEPRDLTATLPLLASARVTQQAPNTLSVTVDRGGAVRLSFFGVPAIPRLQPALIAPDNLVRVASLLDIAGTKASVVQQRAEAKDYIDMDAILTDGRIDLPTALAAAKAIYGGQFNPLITLKALSFFADGDLASLPQATKDRLVKAVREVDVDRIAVIASAPPTLDDKSRFGR